MHRKKKRFMYWLAVLIFGIAILAGTNVFGEAGNVDGIGDIDLKDVIVSLQVSAGKPVSGVVLTADVNGDNKIGLPEAVYGLQAVAGIICTYKISPENKIFTVSSGEGSVSVTAPVGCEWTAVTNAPSWLTVVPSGSSGSGNGTVYYSITANTGSSYRSGELNIAGKIFTVVQAGAFFPDVYFEAAIRRALNKLSGDILKEDLESLTQLDATYMNIERIEGIQYCTNLKYLHLFGNQITDIKPLVDSSGIGSGDIVSLHTACIWSPCVPTGNPLSITSCNVYVPQLLNRGVDLDYYCESNPVVPFPDSNLEAVIKETLNITWDVHYLDLQGLTSLNGSVREITNLEGLQYCTNLTVLDLSANQISDIKPLVDNSGIGSGDVVSLDSNPLNTTSCTSYVPQLLNRGVNLTHNCP
ncbi:MAG: leucine-rich repeat domain-containing protein [Desulfococcaceae bacterium]